MKKYTVLFDQINRINFQAIAPDPNTARRKAEKLYNKNIAIPASEVEDGWKDESEGEDK